MGRWDAVIATAGAPIYTPGPRRGPLLISCREALLLVVPVLTVKAVRHCATAPYEHSFWAPRQKRERALTEGCAILVIEDI